MAAKKTQIGTLVVKQRSKSTTYPVHRADFGVLKYTDSNEIWFDVAAGKAIAGARPSQEDEYEPQMFATVYRNDVDVSNFSGVKLTIPAPREALDRPHSDAHLNYQAGYDEPELLGPCTIRIGEKSEEVYPVHWKATVDFHSGTRPDKEFEVDVRADFTLRVVKDVPCTLHRATRRRFDRWMMILLPVCGIAGYIVSMYIHWLRWWGGIAIGVLVAAAIAKQIDARWQRRMWELKQGGQVATHTVPDDAGEEE